MCGKEPYQIGRGGKSAAKHQLTVGQLWVCVNFVYPWNICISGSATLSSLSPATREAVDPIAELLSQLREGAFYSPL
jgi:hypothetical protein